MGQSLDLDLVAARGQLPKPLEGRIKGFRGRNGTLGAFKGGLQPPLELLGLGLQRRPVAPNDDRPIEQLPQACGASLSRRGVEFPTGRKDWAVNWPFHRTGAVRAADLRPEIS